MGSPASSFQQDSAAVTPASPAVAQAAEQADGATLAEVTDEENFDGEWFVVRQRGKRAYLAEVPGPHGATAGYTMFGPATYFYGTRQEAEEVAEQVADVVAVKLTAVFQK